MKIIHFNADSAIYPFLVGEKYVYGLDGIAPGKTFDCEAISIHVASKIDSTVFDHFPNLKLILTRSVGTDHIDIKECESRNVAVYRIVDYGSFAIAEHALALMLYGARNLGTSQENISKGKFSLDGLCGNTIYKKTVGIIGTGRIGHEFIKLLKPFEANVVAYDLFPNHKHAEELKFKHVDLKELLSTSDFISLHAPLTPESEHLINSESIPLMKEGVVLINTARGGLIDTQALVKNIKKFSFVGLDVLEDEEKFDKNHPLLKFKNVLITPHIAFFTDVTVKKIAEETQKNIERFLTGDPYGRVTS